MPLTTRIRFTLLAAAALLWAALVLAAQPAAASPADQAPAPTPTPVCGPDFDWTPWGGCRPVQQPCPAGTIDVNGNGVDDGDCELIDTIPPIDGCALADGVPNADGHVGCVLPWGQRLTAAVGCLDIGRTPYPRAIVGVPVELLVERILPPSRLAGVAFGSPGSYRLSTSEAWTTEGLYLHERYGPTSTDSFGRRAFDTRGLLAGDAHPYPSLNNVRAYLKFTLDTGAGGVSWMTDRWPSFRPGGLGAPFKTIYPRASFPLPDYADIFSPYGPALNGANNLPAFKLRVRSYWRLTLTAEWDTYDVNGSNQYVRTGHMRVERPFGMEFMSLRAWDDRQAPAGVGDIYCNAAAGYVPVPVIEAQTVLQR